MLEHSVNADKMSEYRFYSYSDFQLYNKSENFFNLPFERYAATYKPKTSEDLTTELNVPYTIFEILVAVMAIVGNLMVIVVFQRDKKLRRRTNYYIVSLAIADFLVGLLGVPFAILASVGLPTNLHACLFTVSLLVVLCTISIFCLVAVSIDRYWAILYPMAYSRNVRTKTAIGIISMCWLAGTIVGFLPLFGWHAQVGENQACLFVEVMDYNYLVFLYFATIITPALLLLAFYAHIYRVIIRQVKQIVTMNPIGESSRRSSFSHITTNSNRPNGGTMLRVLGAARKRDVKATQNLSVIVLFFMICWIPLYTINCIKAFCPNCYVHPKLTFFCIILSHLNSAVNPVLYAYHLKDFRAALKNLILKILGIEIEQQPDLAYRVSLASQQRLQSIVDKRTSLHSKIYIDSPVWLRQQQQLKESPKKSAITCSLNSVHQTVAAVASTTTDINRDIWQIPEVSIGAEETSINGKTETSITDNTTFIFEGAVSMERQFSYDNKNFSTSINELDDDVFLPATPTKQSPSIDAYIQKDLAEKEDLYLSKLPILDSNSDFDSFSIVQQNSIVPALSDNSIQTYNPSNGSILSKDFDGKEMSRQNSVFMIENDTNLLSPDRVPRIKKVSRIPSPFMSKAGRITRSCSCTNDGELVQHSEKFNPLRVVSTIIFPPVKHSSLFHIFDSYKNSDIIGERKRRTSQS